MLHLAWNDCLTTCTLTTCTIWCNFLNISLLQVLIDSMSAQHDKLANQKNNIEMNLNIFYETLQEYKKKSKLNAEFIRWRCGVTCHTWETLIYLKTVVAKTDHLTTYDSVFGKRVLMYWENRGNLKYHQMNVFMAAMRNYIFLERGEPHLSENI